MSDQGNPAFVRWFCLACFIFTSLGVSFTLGLANSVYAADKTFITYGIMLLFSVASVLFGMSVLKNGEGVDTKPTEELMEILTSLGLLGTVIGLVISVHGTFSGIDVVNPDSVREAITKISGGVGAALVTTLAGLIGSLLLKAQIMIVKLNILPRNNRC